MAIQSGLANPNRPTLESSHSMFISAGIGILFVVLAIILAGQSDAWGNAMIALVTSMLILQALVNADMFAAFASKVKITPPQ